MIKTKQIRFNEVPETSDSSEINYSIFPDYVSDRKNYAAQILERTDTSLSKMEKTILQEYGSIDPDA